MNESVNENTETPTAAETVTDTPQDAAQTPQETAQDTPQGAPESYDFSAFCTDGAELDEAKAAEFSEVLKAAGMTQAQASAVTEYGLAYAREIAAEVSRQAAEAQTAEVESWGDEARETLGADFDKTVAKAAIGVTVMEREIPELRAMLDATGVGNRVEAIRLFAAIGGMVGEDTGRATGQTAASGDAADFYDNTNFDLY